MRFIGVDPGDRWVGYAVLSVEFGVRSKIYTSCGVLDLELRGIAGAAGFIYDALPAELAVEDYRVRPQGFNKFSRGATLRLIGALEYIVAARSGHSLLLIPPASPDAELKELRLDGWLNDWREDWPRPKDPAWDHARSAWRVLARALLREDSSLLLSVGKATDPKPHPTMRDGVSSRTEFHAPTTKWSIG